MCSLNIIHILFIEYHPSSTRNQNPNSLFTYLNIHRKLKNRSRIAGTLDSQIDLRAILSENKFIDSLKRTYN